MAIIYRHIEHQDYSSVRTLLNKYNFSDLPTYDELRSIGVVAEMKNQIIGFIWALTNGKSAYLDYFTVHADYRDAKKMTALGEKRGSVATGLLLFMLNILKNIGVQKFFGSMSDCEMTDSVVPIYSRYGLDAIPAKCIMTGNVQEVIKNIQG